jgi:hypothetical protein
MNNFYIDLKIIYIKYIMTEESKKISITGTNNKYQMKKMAMNYEKEVKKRLHSEKWTVTNDQYEYANQLKMVNDISNNIVSDITKIAIQEINKKIAGYKQQDKIKKLFDESKFLTLESVINKMVECELKCRYCLKEMNVLYDILREMTQWSVDRVDNNLGHNIGNFHLACLDCNLKRRRRTDEKFLFTKQLNIIKQDTKDIKDI